MEGHEGQPQRSLTGALAGAVLLVALTCAAYLPSLRGAFILDDHVLVTRNDLIKASDGVRRFWLSTEAVDYWPVTNTSFWVEWRLWETNTTGYHLTNLALHVGSALLLWLVLIRLSIPGAYLAALLFALHPVNVESVAWISQRKNLLALVFLLLSVLWFLRTDTGSPDPTGVPARGPGGNQKGRRRTSRSEPGPVTESEQRSPRTELWYGLSLAAFTLAMLSKGSAAPLPLLLLGIIAWKRPLAGRDLLRTVPYFLVAGGFTLVNVWFQSRLFKADVEAANFLDRLLGAGAAVWFYLGKALLPIHLSFVYPKWRIDAADPRWWAPLVAAVVSTGVLWAYRRSWARPLLFGWAFFGLWLAPVMGFTDFGFMRHSLVADHYQHIALIAVVALAAAAWLRWKENAAPPVRWLPGATAIAVVAALALLTWRQAGVYSDGITLYRAALEENPTSSFLQNNLGLVLLDEVGRPAQASEHFEEALRIDPTFAEAHYNLARTRLAQDRLDEAIEQYEAAARQRPTYPEYQHDLAAALVRAGRAGEAGPFFEQAARLRPEDARARYDLGNALIQAGRTAEAIEQFREAIRLDPAHAEAENNLGAALTEAGQRQEALDHYRRSVALRPDFAEARSNLGRALLQAGQAREAVEHLQRAVEIDPSSPSAHNDLGVALAESGDPRGAAEQFRKVLSLKPDDVAARANLDEVLAGDQP